MEASNPYGDQFVLSDSNDSDTLSSDSSGYESAISKNVFDTGVQTPQAAYTLQNQMYVHPNSRYFDGAQGLSGASNDTFLERQQQIPPQFNIMDYQNTDNPMGAINPSSSPAAFKAQLDQILGPDDKRKMQAFASQARFSALLTTLAMGFSTYSMYKKREFRYPLLSALATACTLGPPIGFSGYMLLNYKTVQELEVKLRNVQTAFQQQKNMNLATQRNPLSYYNNIPTSNMPNGSILVTDPSMDKPESDINPSELLK